MRFILVLLFIIVILLIPERFSDFSVKYHYALFAISLLGLLIHLRNQKIKNWLRIDLIFIIGFFIVHLQWPLLSILGIEPENFDRIWINKNIANYASWLSTLGLISWYNGFNLLYIPQENTLKNNIVNNGLDNNTAIKNSFFINSSLILFIAFILTVGKDFLSGNYLGEQNWSTVSSYIYILFQTLIVLSWVIELYNNKKSRSQKTLKLIQNLDKKLILLTLCYLLLFLSIGDRGGPLQLISAIFVTYSAIYRNFKLLETFIGITICALLFTLIGIGRSSQEGSSLLEGISLFEYSGFHTLTLELSNSIRTLYTALIHVPDYHEYFYGQLWLSNILSVIPFAQNIFINATGMEVYELGSAGYITFITFGPASISGEGTTLIGDIYLNFGGLGVVFFMGILGYIFSKIIWNTENTTSIKWLLLNAIFATIALYISRGSFFMFLRPLFWSIFILWLFTKIKWKVRIY